MSAAPKPPILVVEDENVVAMDIVSSLEQLDYPVAGIAARGDDALKMASESQPGLVLMDINLRGPMDGIAAAQQIQQGLQIPVVYLTAYSDDATLDRARVTYPFGYLLKPFENRELEVAIQVALYRHRMDSALRGNERRLDAILRSISDAVIATDENRRVTFLNRSAETLLGWKSERARERPLAQVLQTSSGGEGYQALVRGRAEVPVEIDESPVTDSTGPPTGYVTVIRDVSERVRAQNAHERALVEQAARSAVENERERAQLLGDVSSMLADSFDRPAPERFQEVARRIVPLLGDWCVVDAWDGDMPGRMAIAHADPAQARLAERFRQCPPDGRASKGSSLTPWAGEARFLQRVRDECSPSPHTATGFEKLLREAGARSLISVPLIARSTILGVLTVFWSESDRAYDEDDLEFIKQLADRCAVAFDNARLYSQSQGALRLRDEFLSIASHELRTPLSPLQMQIELLEERSRRMVPGDSDYSWLQSGLTMIRRQGHRLNRLVEELLELSRILGGRLHLEVMPIDLVEIVREVAEETGARKDLPASELRVSVPRSIVGRWDRLRLQQIVSNLVTNAFKYGQQRPIDLRARVEGGFALLEVEDRGIGISAEDQERIFGRFERAVSARHYGGFGLGLFIARESVESLGGSIAVRSKAGDGSTFTVRLPLAGPASQDATVETASPLG